MVMPRSRSSGALSIWSKATNCPRPFAAWVFVMAAVSVVLPWSMCPMVPTFTWGFLRSNFAFAMGVLPPSRPSFARSARLRGLREARTALAQRLGPDALRHRLVVGELHREGRAPLAARPEIRRVSEHLREWHRSGDHLGVAPGLLPADAPAAPVDVADDVADEVVRRDHLEAHDGLEDHGGCLGHRLLERHRAGDLERHLRRVDLVIGAEGDRGLHVHHGVAGEDAGLHCLLHALLDRRDVLARDDPAFRPVDEGEPFTRLRRLDLQDDVAVLAAATGLANEARLLLGRLADGLLVGDVRLADVGVDLELA